MAQAIGRCAEDIVALYLKKHGLSVLEKNVVFPFGEIDIVAKEGATLVFVEVKYRKDLSHGFPNEFVNRKKQEKIIRAAQAYLARLAVVPFCRFDVVSMWGDLSDPRIEHLRDAFMLEGR